MAASNQQNFILFYSEFDQEDVEDIEAELLRIGILPERSQNIILQQIKKARAELKIEKGKNIIEKYKEKLKTLFPGQTTSAAAIDGLAIEFRKLGKNLDEDDLKQINDEAEKLEILRRIIEDEEKKMNG